MSEYKINEILAPKPESAYTADAINASYLVAIDPDNLTYYGSNALKSQTVSSADIDLIEKIPKNIKNRNAYIAKRIQQIVKKIDNTKDVLLGDFKAGLDHRYNIDIGKIEKGKVVGYNRDEVFQRLEMLDFTREEKYELNKLLQTPKLTITKFFELQEILRNRYILRWNKQELLNGYKMVDSNKITLESAIAHDSLVKIDTIQIINGVITEVTNVFDILGASVDINSKKFIQSLVENMMKYLIHGNYFKTAKRLFTYAKVKNNWQIIKVVYPLLHSSLGTLYKVVANMKAIAYILENYDNISASMWDAMLKNINALKESIASIFDFKIPELTIYKEIDDISTLKNTELNRSRLLNSINDMVLKLNKPLNEYTNDYLHEHKLVKTIASIIHSN